MDFSYLTVLPRGRQIWDYAVFPPEEFATRKERISKALDKAGLDGFIVYSDGMSRRYVSYLTNYCNSVAWSCCVCLITREDIPKMISSLAPRDINYNLKSLAPNVELNAIGLGMLTNHKVADKAMEYMRDHDMMGKKWGGVNIGSLNHDGQQAIYQAIPGLGDYTALYDEVLMCKDNAEIFAMAQATTMAQKAVLDYLRLAVPGANEQQIAARIDCQFRSYGVDNIAFLVSAGSGKEVSLHQPRDYVIQEGDTVSAHVDILYLHYNGMFAASMYRGTADAERLNYYHSVEKEYADLLASISANRSYDNVNSQSENGYVLVKGIGADVAESPYCEANGCAAVNGQTFTLTLSRNSEQFGGMLIADTYAMTESGVHVIGGPGMDRMFVYG